MSDNINENQLQLRYLHRALERINRTPPRLIASPITQPRRAAVAVILQIIPPPNYVLPDSQEYVLPKDLDELFNMDWVKQEETTAEILFIKRRHGSAEDRVSRGESKEHVAFPGGRVEPGDEGSLYTAMRQTWEEIGIDLAEPEWLKVGQMDDREITTSLGKRLLMVLSPFVFVRTTPYPIHASPPIIPPSPTGDPADATITPPPPILYTVSFKSLLSKNPKWSYTTIDISSRLAPVPRTGLLSKLFGKPRRSSRTSEISLAAGAAAAATGGTNFWLWIMRALWMFAVRTLLVGDMKFSALVLSGKIVPFDDSPTLEQDQSYPQMEKINLWGLTLGMTLDLLSYMQSNAEMPNSNYRFGSRSGNSPVRRGRSGSPVSALGLGSGEAGIKLEIPGEPNGDVEEDTNGPWSIRPPSLDESETWSSTSLWTPSMASVFPRFSIPDVNFWIWVFGKRYRQIIRDWEVSLRFGGKRDHRINWSGQALSAFYEAVRKALIVVIILRIMGVLFGVGIWAWWSWRRWW
ncbi:hypothetical protein FRC03_006195 [Tulasnella sp. 419]|nr:hypothetical protein FRC03_006195 [Tulasnella sp. 419]